ncbi:MAG: ADP-ribosylglycohydrolase family protein [Bacteroidales bacterium]|nr:ADP-ribosylglycohydrolase family protein [Bacteroidales bacterium]
MLGAITGDTIGSVYEFNNIKTTQFPLFQSRSTITDDSVMTMAVAEWLLLGPSRSQKDLERIMVEYGQGFPNAGYGGRFRCWLFEPERLHKNGGQSRVPYNSFGNGSAMRVSSCGWFFDSLAETEYWAEQSAIITHNHPEGVKGAQATAAAIFMARQGATKDEIMRYVERTYGYDLSLHCDDIRPTYRFNETCQETVPQAFAAFLDSTDFESCIRLGVSLGGDTDTLCAIAAPMAEAYYGGVPESIAVQAWVRMPRQFRQLMVRFAAASVYRLPLCCH